MSLVKDLKLNKLSLSHVLIAVAVFALIFGFNNYSNNKYNNNEGMNGSPYGDNDETNMLDSMANSMNLEQEQAEMQGPAQGEMQASVQGQSQGNQMGTSLDELGSVSMSGDFSSQINDIGPANGMQKMVEITDAEWSVTKPTMTSKSRNPARGINLIRGEPQIQKTAQCPWNQSTMDYVQQNSIMN